jgi:glycine/serine hydroxymethyltransferase
MDIRINRILAKEVARQENTIELIASENFASEALEAAQAWQKTDAPENVMVVDYYED